MNRKETTKLLTDVLINDKLGDRKYYAREVTVDYGTATQKRCDVVEFQPQGVIRASDIEKGIFICYEIKSCKEDIFSGNGLNFWGEKNYIVTTMDTYKKIQEYLREGRLAKYLHDNYPESSLHYGIMVAVPSKVDVKNTDDVYSEFEHPTKFGGNPEDWRLYTAVPCREGSRTRSITELLFCMLRSKHSYTNQR